MKNKENLIELINYLDFAKRELEAAINEKQSLSQTARNLSITPNSLSAIKNHPLYFRGLLLKKIPIGADLEIILSENQNMEEKLFKTIFNPHYPRPIVLTDLEQETIRSIFENITEPYGKEIMLLKIDDNLNKSAFAKEHNLTQNEINQIENRVSSKLKRNIYQAFKDFYLQSEHKRQDTFKVIKPENTYYEKILKELLNTKRRMSLNHIQEQYFRNFLEENYLENSSKNEIIEYLRNDKDLLHQLITNLFERHYIVTTYDTDYLGYDVYPVLWNNHIRTMDEFTFYKEDDLANLTGFDDEIINIIKQNMKKYNINFRPNKQSLAKFINKSNNKNNSHTSKNDFQKKEQPITPYVETINSKMEEKIFKTIFWKYWDDELNFTQETKNEIRSLIENIETPNGREIILLVFNNNLSNDEVSEKLHLPIDYINQVGEKSLEEIKQKIIETGQYHYIVNSHCADTVVNTIQRELSYFELLLQDILETKRVIILNSDQEKTFETFLIEHEIKHLSREQIISHLKRDKILLYGLLKNIIPDIKITLIDSNALAIPYNQLITLEESGLNSGICNILQKHGLQSLNELELYTKEEIQDINGFGETKFNNLINKMNQYNIQFKE